MFICHKWTVLQEMSIDFFVTNIPFSLFSIPVATSEDSPVAMKLKKMWLKTPVSEEQAAQAVLDPAIGKYSV